MGVTFLISIRRCSGRSSLSSWGHSEPRAKLFLQKALASPQPEGLVTGCVKAPEPMGRGQARGGRGAPAWVLQGTLLLDLKTGQTRGPVTQTRSHSGMCWRMRHRYSAALTCFKLFPLVDVRTLNET